MIRRSPQGFRGWTLRMLASSILLVLLLLLSVQVIGRLLPRTGEIAFMGRQDLNWDIYVLDLQRGIVDRVTYDLGNNRYPAWSPDGSQIAFHSDRANVDSRFYDLFVMAPDGRDVQRLTADNMRPFTRDDAQGSFAQGNAMAAWSPDGRLIAFHSDVGGDWDLFLMNADGTSVRPLIRREGDEVLLSWSPDGRRSLFSMGDTNAVYELYIYVMDMESEDITQLTYEDTVPSPYGTPDPSGGVSPSLQATATALAPRSPLSTNQPRVIQDWHPEWSPDGEAFVFAGERDTYSDNLFLYDLPSGKLTQLTNTVYTDHNPVWTRDGEYILFASDRGATTQIYIMRRDGSDVRPVTALDFENNAPVWRP